jgi:sigma-E factor negative regulatory protein RseA
MSDLLHEQLSALLDGELPPEETALLMRRLEREPELARRLARYRVCGEVLRGERVQPSADFALRVSEAIAAEPAVHVAVPRRRVPARLKSAAGLAVAASVGMVAVLVLQRAVPGTLGPAATVADAGPAVAADPVVAPVATAPMPVVESLPALATVSPGSEPPSYVTPAAKPGLQEIRGATLANYVVAHSGVSGPLGGRSVLIHLLADPPADGGQ